MKLPPHLLDVDTITVSGIEQRELRKYWAKVHDVEEVIVPKQKGKRIEDEEVIEQLLNNLPRLSRFEYVPLSYFAEVLEVGVKFEKPYVVVTNTPISDSTFKFYGDVKMDSGIFYHRYDSGFGLSALSESVVAGGRVWWDIYDEPRKVKMVMEKEINVLKRREESRVSAWFKAEDKGFKFPYRLKFPVADIEKHVKSITRVAKKPATRRKYSMSVLNS